MASSERTRKNASDNEDPELEGKMQDYHRQGGAHGGAGAKNAEAEIGSSSVARNDEHKKGRPRSSPGK